MATSAPEEVLDGRAARAQRTRRAVVDALLALIDEGDVRPTAPRIAERAGVSLRSIFQHFTDLEALFSAASEREMERLLALVRPLPLDGPLDARIEAFVAQRARVLESVTPVRRAALLQEPFSAELQATRDRLLAMARGEVESVFQPELARHAKRDRAELLAALDAVSSWDMWESLRAHQRLSVGRARRVLARTLRALLSDDAGMAEKGG